MVGSRRYVEILVESCITPFHVSACGRGSLGATVTRAQDLVRLGGNSDHRLSIQLEEEPGASSHN
jgi:hypothetical protein